MRGVVRGSRYACGVDYWDEIVGQADAVDMLQRASEPGAVPAHAWLITGPRGTGKATLAWSMAKALLSGATADDLTSDPEDLGLLLAGHDVRIEAV